MGRSVPGRQDGERTEPQIWVPPDEQLSRLRDREAWIITEADRSVTLLAPEEY